MDFVNVEDARRAARCRLPRIFFDYIDGGAFSEATLRANEAEFGRWNLVQRVLTAPPVRDLATTVLGARQALPLVLGPVGFLGLFSGHGETRAARAAHAAGIPFCLSTFSIDTLSTIRAATPGPLHFQLYVLEDRGLGDELLAEAERVGVDTLWLTVDTTVTSVRERDDRNGFRALTRLTPGLLARFARHPRWCLDLLSAGGLPQMGAVAGRPGFGSGVMAQAAAVSRRIDQRLSWADVARLRARWKGRLVVKGLMEPEDALRARDEGADAVVVSNHGGRQLDCAGSTIARLPAVVDALAGSAEVLVDSGIRRGSDIVKALALGASGVAIGRAFAFGLAAGGETGVARVVEILARELDITLSLMGLGSIDDLKARGRAAVRPSGGAT